jgi:hypothetical protein
MGVGVWAFAVPHYWPREGGSNLPKASGPFSAPEGLWLGAIGPWAMAPLGLLGPHSSALVLLVAMGGGVWGVGHGMAPKLGVSRGVLCSLNSG